MKFLFFDIECANCFGGTGKICEFGYVLTDECFNEIDRDIILINPKDRFDWYVAKNLLAYNVGVYKRAPEYPHFFERIKRFFTDDDIMIFGHTVDSDIKYLNDEARRYSLPFFECKFYDAKYMYCTYAQKPEQHGVSKICELLEIDSPDHAHKSVDDAYATMLIVKELCKRMGVDALGLIKSSEDCVGETKEGVIKTAAIEHARKRREAAVKNNFMRGDNKFKFIRFIKAVKPQGEIRSNELTGKKISFSLNYEYNHFKQMLSIVQLLINCGAKYWFRASEADCYVSYRAVDDEGNEKVCARQNYVNDAIAQGAQIKIITLDELMSILGVTAEEIDSMPLPDKSLFEKNPRQSGALRENSKKGYFDGFSPATLADFTKKSGVDFSALTAVGKNK